MGIKPAAELVNQLFLSTWNVPQLFPVFTLQQYPHWAVKNKQKQISVLISYSRVVLYIGIIKVCPKISPKNQLDIYFVTSRRNWLGIAKPKMSSDQPIKDIVFNRIFY